MPSEPYAKTVIRHVEIMTMLFQQALEFIPRNGANDLVNLFNTSYDQIELASRGLLTQSEIQHQRVDAEELLNAAQIATARASIK